MSYQRTPSLGKDINVRTYFLHEKNDTRPTWISRVPQQHTLGVPGYQSCFFQSYSGGYPGILWIIPPGTRVPTLFFSVILGWVSGYTSKYTPALWAQPCKKQPYAIDRAGPFHRIIFPRQDRCQRTYIPKQSTTATLAGNRGHQHTTPPLQPPLDEENINVVPGEERTNVQHRRI